MKAGQQIIWDSGAGYEIGFFLGVDERNSFHVNIDLISGRCHGKISMPESEVIPYSEETVNTLHEQYGYRHQFPEQPQCRKDTPKISSAHSFTEGSEL